MLSHQIHPAFVLQLVLQNCKLPYQIVLHSLGHLLCRAVTIVDGAVQLLCLRITQVMAN